MSGYITGLEAAGTLDGRELIEIAQLSSSIRISAGTISAAAADNSFNDSGSGFVAAGFEEGDRVGVFGFTGNVANNLAFGIIGSLTTAKMIIAAPEGDAIIDDAAGETVLIAKWETKRLLLSDASSGLSIGDLIDVDLDGLADGDILIWDASSMSFIAAANSGGGGGSSYAATTTISAADTDLLASHAGQYLRFTEAGAKTLTVQAESAEPLASNSEFHIRNVGAADLTLIEDSGVTINPPNGGTLVIPQDGTATLKRIASDEFDLFGQVVAL